MASLRALLAILVVVATPAAGNGSAPASGAPRSLLQPKLPIQLQFDGSLNLGYPVAAASQVASAACAGWTRAVILKNGTAVIWGEYVETETPNGRIHFVTAGSPVQSLSIGYFHVLALLKNGSVLKVSTGGNTSLPPRVAAATDIVSVAAGSYVNVAVRSSGDVLAWGTDDKQVVSQLSRLTGVKSVSIGWSTKEDDDFDTVAVLFKNKTVQVLCSNNRYRQLDVPAKVSAGKVTAVAAGARRVLALAGDEVVAWGEVPGVIAVPKRARKGIAAIAVGEEHSIALTSDAQVLCWGRVGHCKGAERITTTVRGIAAGDGYSAVIGTDSKLYTWEGPSAGDYMYELPAGLRSVSVFALAAGADHALILLNNGSVTAFGSNRWGQSSVPPDAAQAGAVQAIAAGEMHSLALLTTGRVVSWGKPLAAVPADRSAIAGIAAGIDVSCVVYATSRQVECFGNTQRLALDLVTGIAVSKLVVKRLNAVVLTSDGHVINFGAWSDAGMPDYARSNAMDVAVSRDAVLVLLNNGSLVGFNMRDPKTVVSIPEVTCDRVSKVNAGNSAFIAICDDGQAFISDFLNGKNEAYTEVLDADGGIYFRLFRLGTPRATDPPPLPPSPPPLPVLAVLPAGQINKGPSSTTTHDTDDSLDPEPSPHSNPVVNPASINPARSSPTAQPHLSVDPNASQNGGTSSSKATAVGAAVGGSAAGLLLLAAVAWVARSRKADFAWCAGAKANPVAKEWADNKNQLVLRAADTKPEELNLIGVGKGELYARTTAHEYTWSHISSASPNLVAVEAGINDEQLDKLLVNNGDENDGCPVIQLTQDELKEQIHLLQDGLLGKGATAVAFKALWPSRFGPDAVVAIKMLKDGHEADIAELQSFAYEASVLRTTKHPNVVTMYGYCLEPPTVCLILEVLQHSLKDMLYSSATPAGTSTAQSHPRAGSSHHSVSHILNHPALLLPIPEPAPSCASLDDVLDEMTPGIQITLAEDGSPPVSAIELHSTPTRTPQRFKDKSPSLALSIDTLGTTLTMARVLEISRDIAAGLAYLHDTPLEGAAQGLEPDSVPPPGHFRHSSRRVSEIIADLEDRASPRCSDAGIRPGRIVHRDLKPANVLLNSRGKACLSDFGLAREHQQTSVHTERVGAGTLPYMAPELLMSSYGNSYLPMTNKVDIYSCAMIIYEMLARQMPWKGLGEMAVLAAVTGSRRPELPMGLSSDGAALPSRDVLAQPASLTALPELNSIIRACWHQRYHKRPSAAELHAQLARLLQE